MIDQRADLAGRNQIVLQRERDLFLHRQGNDLVLGILKEHVDRPTALSAIKFATVDQALFGMVDDDTTMVLAAVEIWIHTHEIQRKGTFSGATGTEDEDELSLVYNKVDVLQSKNPFPPRRLEPEGVVLDNKGRLTHHCSCRRRQRGASRV